MRPDWRHLRAALCALLTAACLAGCASREVLPTYGARVPAGIDLAGDWQIAAGSRDTIARLHNAEIVAAGGRARLLPDRGRSSGDKESLVHVFVETGESLKITQTDFALFISFDRAIVEEYRFGEYRTISVGPVTASRSSGWDGATYVVETLDAEGSKLRERYLLSDDGDALLRQISIFKRGSLALSLVQRFERQ